MIIVLLPRGTTGKVCLKSPPRTKTVPPNGMQLPIISCSSLLIQRSEWHIKMAASSIRISAASLKDLAFAEYEFKLEVDVSVIGGQFEVTVHSFL